MFQLIVVKSCQNRRKIVIINNIGVVNQNQNRSKQSFKATINLKPFANGAIHQIPGIENCQTEIVRVAGRDTLNIKRGLEIIFSANIYRPASEFAQNLARAIDNSKNNLNPDEIVHFQ